MLTCLIPFVRELTEALELNGEETACCSLNGDVEDAIAWKSDVPEEICCSIGAGRAGKDESITFWCFELNDRGCPRLNPNGCASCGGRSAVGDRTESEDVELVCFDNAGNDEDDWIVLKGDVS